VKVVELIKSLVNMPADTDVVVSDGNVHHVIGKVAFNEKEKVIELKLGDE